MRNPGKKRPCQISEEGREDFGVKFEIIAVVDVKH
jgi:hypothetical protein